jgi:hypothetical protein
MITTHALPTAGTAQAASPDGTGALQVPDVKGGFTRRCAKRDPVDKSPCMHEYGHAGRHAWEPAYF